MIRISQYKTDCSNCSLDVDVIQVKNLSEWKSQLADKNKEIKEENKRFV